MKKIAINVFVLPFFFIWLIYYLAYAVILLMQGYRLQEAVNIVVEKSTRDVNTIFVISAMLWIYIILLITK